MFVICFVYVDVELCNCCICWLNGYWWVLFMWELLLVLVELLEVLLVLDVYGEGEVM